LSLDPENNDRFMVATELRVDSRSAIW